jgi:hypothetical protein
MPCSRAISHWFFSLPPSSPKRFRITSCSRGSRMCRWLYIRFDHLVPVRAEDIDQRDFISLFVGADGVVQRHVLAGLFQGAQVHRPGIRPAFFQPSFGVSNALNSRPKKHLPIRRFPDGAFLQPLLEGLFSSMHFVLKLYANGYEKREINN